MTQEELKKIALKLRYQLLSNPTCEMAYKIANYILSFKKQDETRLTEKEKEFIVYSMEFPTSYYKPITKQIIGSKMDYNMRAMIDPPRRVKSRTVIGARRRSKVRSIRGHKIATRASPEIKPKIQAKIRGRARPEIKPKIQAKIRGRTRPGIAPKIQAKIRGMTRPRIAPKMMPQIDPGLFTYLSNEELLKLIELIKKRIKEDN